MLVVIDNYDSFTYNLVQYFGELAREFPVAADIEVYRNDRLDLEQLARLAPDGVVISPGPGGPPDAGISRELIRTFAPTLPILGVCLGHQCLGDVCGGQVKRASSLMHGKTSLIYHSNVGVFEGLENPFTATRYHSLVVDRESLPPQLEVTAWVEDGTIMGLRHRDYPQVQGVQFHPESILTDSGKLLLTNFLRSLARRLTAIAG